MTGKQGHAVSAVAAADAARWEASTDDDSDGVDDADESDTDVEPTDSVDEPVGVRGPATATERLPDHVKQVHQTVRDFLASRFGGASDE